MNETLETMGRALFLNRFVETTKTGLPKGWRYATIAELCNINSWTLGNSDELDRIEYVEISEVVRGEIGNVQLYERGKEPSRARRRLRHGTRFCQQFARIAARISSAYIHRRALSRQPASRF